jgi:hypothetical protein
LPLRCHWTAEDSVTAILAAFDSEVHVERLEFLAVPFLGKPATLLGRVGERIEP